MRPRRFRRPILVGCVALVSLLAVPLGASAAPPTFHDHFSDTFPANVCGIDVTVQLDVNQVVRLTFDEAGNVVAVKATGQVTQVFTAANGKSVTVKATGQYRQESVTENPDGTITFVESWRGLPEKIVGAKGGPLLRDAGLIQIATTVDFSGPEPVVTDQQILVNHGPHPEAESDFALFCEVITGALA